MTLPVGKNGRGQQSGYVKNVKYAHARAIAGVGSVNVKKVFFAVFG